MDLDRAKKHFTEHVLTKVVDAEGIKVFRFAKPDTGIYSQQWIIQGGKLIVTGDCYAAIYQWSGAVNIPFLANCGIGYFSEKCCADKDGQFQRKFDSSECVDKLKGIAFDRIYEDEGLFAEEFEGWAEMNLAQKEEICKPIIMRECGFDFNHEYEGVFEHETIQEAHEVISKSEYRFMFGTDTCEYELKSRTATPYFHLAALQVAHEMFPDIY